MLGKFPRIRSVGRFLSVLCVTTMISNPISYERSTTIGLENGKMKLSLTRILRTNDRTLGILRLSGDSGEQGNLELRTLEPPLRAGKPRSIPAGTYVVKVLQQPGNTQPRLLLQSVVDFSNVYIEVGNFPKDTRGCILVGLEHVPSGLKDSQKAYSLLLELVGASSEFLLVISDVQPSSIPKGSLGLNGIYPPWRFPPIHP